MRICMIGGNLWLFGRVCVRFFFGFQHVFFLTALRIDILRQTEFETSLSTKLTTTSTGKKNNTFLNGSVDYEIIEMSKVYKNSI